MTTRDDEIAAINEMLLARRAERAGVAAKPPAAGEEPQRPPVDLSGITKNDFRAGLPTLSDQQTAEMVAAYRAGYQRYALDPNYDAIVAGMEAKLKEALAADGKTLPALSPADRLRMLRSAASKRGHVG